MMRTIRRDEMVTWYFIATLMQHRMANASSAHASIISTNKSHHQNGPILEEKRFLRENLSWNVRFSSRNCAITYAGRSAVASFVLLSTSSRMFVTQKRWFRHEFPPEMIKHKLQMANVPTSGSREAKKGKVSRHVQGWNLFGCCVIAHPNHFTHHRKSYFSSLVCFAIVFLWNLFTFVKKINFSDGVRIFCALEKLIKQKKKRS